MNATMTRSTLSPASHVPSVDASTAAPAVSGVPLLMLRLEGALALAGTLYAYHALGGRWSLFALLFLLPDLSMLGYLAGRRVGAACYNALHTYAGPAALAGLGVALQRPLLLCVACIWAAHIGMDRLLGYGLKYGTSFGDSHLGRHAATK